MPTVLRVHGFRVSIFFPPREHLPPHVHVSNATGAVIIDLPHGDRPQRVRRIKRMSDADVARAERIVFDHVVFLGRRWRQIWGS